MTITDWLFHPINTYMNLKQIKISEQKSRQHHKKCIAKLQAIQARYDVHYHGNTAQCTLKKTN